MPTAIVTGADSSLGYEFSRLLIREGYDVHATDVSIGARLNSLECSTAQVDVSSQDSVDVFAKSLNGNPVDVLLHVAGFSSASKSGSTGLLSLSSTFATHTFGPIVLTQALLPNLVSSSQPRIGFISPPTSSASVHSTESSSESALHSMARSLATDLQEKGVVVVVMHPGDVKTGSDATAEKSIDPEEATARLWKVFKDKGIKETGTLWHRDGQEIPW